MASMARPCLLRQAAVGRPAQRLFSSSSRSRTTPALNTPLVTKGLNRSIVQQSAFNSSPGLSARVAAFHATSRREILPPLPQRLSGTANEAAPVPHSDSMHGRYHWDAERFVSLALVPVTLAPFAGGSLHPVTDAILCGLIVIHSHIGFQSVIIDYVPSKRVPKSRIFFNWVLNLGSLVVAYGFYEFETNDVGLVEFIKRVWHA